MFNTELPSPSPVSKSQRDSSEFKSEVIAQARQPHVSIASVALSHGLNANLLRKWIQYSDPSYVTTRQARLQERAGPAVSVDRPAFLPISLADTPKADSQSIEIEVNKGDTVTKVKWPVRASVTCPGPMHPVFITNLRLLSMTLPRIARASTPEPLSVTGEAAWCVMTSVIIRQCLPAVSRKWAAWRMPAVSSSNYMWPTKASSLSRLFN
jgi:transposase